MALSFGLDCTAFITLPEYPATTEDDLFMRIGVPKEIKSDEYRVAMMPVGVELLVKGGHQVFVEDAGGRGQRIS